MAVGKGSMQRAAKAAEKKTVAGRTVKKAPAKSVSAVTADDPAEGAIVYEENAGMLTRAAEPNERFAIGDAMPVYYF
ncbi:MAG: hypothetical protein K6G83_07510 [Lachnospiraceae bacterium]|nr:hypothetical protein [Lachnospiraceae bacterium]